MPLGAMKPTVGRIVHYVLTDGQHRPAIVVRAWGEEPHSAPDYADSVNLQVFLDGSNDGSESGVDWETSVRYDETGKTPYTWHWPEREGAPA